MNNWRKDGPIASGLLNLQRRTDKSHDPCHSGRDGCLDRRENGDIGTPRRI